MTKEEDGDSVSLGDDASDNNVDYSQKADVDGKDSPSLGGDTPDNNLDVSQKNFDGDSKEE
jgi:hypothetical protein